MQFTIDNTQYIQYKKQYTIYITIYNKQITIGYIQYTIYIIQ